MKTLIRRSFRRLGIDVRRVQDSPGLVSFLDDRQISVVLDVGANVGQFGTWLRGQGYQQKIISFEPIESAFRELAMKAKTDDNWEAHNYGLGSASGETVINVSKDSVFSSILSLTSTAIEFDDNAVVGRTETIKLRTLDDVLTNIQGNIFLKIDTQGFEKQVLEGGRHSLSRLKGILMELPLIQFYECSWQFHEALEFMSSLGFVPAQIHPVNYHSKDRVSVVEVDCLFRPRNRRWDQADM